MGHGNWKDMFHACSKGHLDLIRYHLDLDVDPNFQHPEYLSTPLIETIRFNHIDAAKLLLSRGADPLIAEQISGSTPIEVALSTKCHAMIDLFLSDGHLKATELPTIKVVVTKAGVLGGKAFARHVVAQGYRVVVDLPDEESSDEEVESWRNETGNSKVVSLSSSLKLPESYSTIQATVVFANDCSSGLMTTSISGKQILVVPKQPSEKPPSHKDLAAVVVFDYYSRWWRWLGFKSRACALQELNETLLDLTFSCVDDRDVKAKVYPYNHYAVAHADAFYF